MDKPDAVFDRVHEWADLSDFVTDRSNGLRIGIVRGRRRHGKSFLLEHACAAVDGVYTLALRQSRGLALARFSDSLQAALGHGLGRFDSWVQALDTAVDALLKRTQHHVPLLVLDEFPYLVAHSPELPSAIQALYDQRGPATGHPPFRLILCGSAISVMSTLLSGDQALRGRAVLDLRIGPFRFRDSAAYWKVQPREAFLVDSVLGGAPGYRDLVGSGPESTSDGFFKWLSRTLLNPSHVLFTEPDYLLAEDPRIGDRAIYHSIWEAVSRGAATPTQIAGLVGMDVKALAYHLRIMEEAAFIRREQDLLLRRKPILTVSDPAVRLHHLIVRPDLIDLEMRNPGPVWDRSQATVSSKILGPHFEHLVREWTTWYGRGPLGLEDMGPVGQTEVPCREHRGHEVDVIALDRQSPPRTKGGKVVLLGESKAGAKVRPAANLERLGHIRDLLAKQGWDTSETQFAIFSKEGFTNRPDGVHLIDLGMMYRE